MSKKTSSQSSSAKTSLNPNPSAYSRAAYGWQTPFQLTLPGPTGPPPPGLWTPIGAPITAGFGYGYPYGQQIPRFPQPLTPHSNLCCLANQRAHHCGGYDQNCNGWPTNVTKMCWNNHSESDNLNSPSPNGVAITEIESKDGSDDELIVEITTNESKDTTNNKSQKKIKELEKSNEELKTDLEETKSQLKRTQEQLLMTKEKMSIESIEKYRQNLKKYGDYIRQEVNRFYQNEEMAQKLKPIVEQITIASNHIKEEKENIKQSVRTIRQAINDNKTVDFDALSFSSNYLPDFPNLLAFYRNILDEIPLIFLSDLSQLKRLANNFIQTKNKLSNTVTNSLTMSLPFGDDPNSSIKPLPSASNTLFSAPNISELPKPDFNTLPHKSVESSPPALDLTFPRSSSPIPLPNSIIDEPIAPTTLLDIIPSNKAKEKPISPIGKPIQPVIDLKAICAENVKNSQQNRTLSAIGQSFRQTLNEPKLETDPIRAPLNPIPMFAKLKAVTTESVTLASDSLLSDMESPKPSLNQAQSKLLVKLKEKYPQMSDVHLIDSMAQTKAVLIATGNPKGFSGMKVADIVNKISEYIDSKVLSNNFSKPRLTELNPKKTLTKTENTIIDKTINPVQKKAWNTVNQKASKYDDTICSICFETISVINKYETECQHFFHHLCISNWIRKVGSCPICRRLILTPGEFPEL